MVIIANKMVHCISNFVGLLVVAGICNAYQNPYPNQNQFQSQNQNKFPSQNQKFPNQQQQQQRFPNPNANPNQNQNQRFGSPSPNQQFGNAKPNFGPNNNNVQNQNQRFSKPNGPPPNPGFNQQNQNQRPNPNQQNPNFNQQNQQNPQFNQQGPSLAQSQPQGPKPPGGKQANVTYETYYKPPNCTVLSQMNDILTIDYVGTFPDGKKFDSTYDRKEPMMYTMGGGQVIKGCEIATMNMCVGEKRKMIIPPHLAYGDEDYGQIPAGSTLHFDTVLVDLQPDPFKAFSNFMMKR